MASIFINPYSSPTNPTTNSSNAIFNSSNTPTCSPSLFFKLSRPHQTIRCCSVSQPNSRPEYIPNKISEPTYVRIFDTTLRDGEQSPGATMTSKQKLDIARQLAKLGVDIIEAGFPASSKDDLEAVKLIATEVGNAVDEDGYVPVICGLARCNRNDIDAAWEGVKFAKRPRIHVFIATSEIHLKNKLKKSKEEVMSIARDMVGYAKSLGCNDIEFSPEDAGRSDKDYLYEILEEVIKAGATTLNIPDTVGYNLFNEFGQLIADIKSNIPGIENVIISTHCQNDLGLATANTIAGANAGARQLEVTVNGIGERAGNASLEEVVMAIKCRGKELLGGLYTGINTKHIVMASKMVAEHSGLPVQPHKAIVGANAFAHESGIHQVVIFLVFGLDNVMDMEKCAGMDASMPEHEDVKMDTKTKSVKSPKPRGPRIKSHLKQLPVKIWLEVLYVEERISFPAEVEARAGPSTRKDDEYYTEIGFEQQPQRQERGTDIEALARALTEQTHDLHLKVPKFDGKSDADAFIDWLDKVEEIFTYKCYGDPKQDGMLKYKGTYEIIAPEDIGLLRSNDYGIVLGKLSGRHALKSRLLELGYELDEKELDDVFWRFKEVAEKKKEGQALALRL
ncbi:hypothetical protein GIB67_012533 [Kingdonia uniflora]|uniref:2-isopropylmalate synthase n=1 Tax=Kingdonia uniflora TaxID=39325 RepID=A0A7J7N5G2_9MAGN|nr:hypothetical protein GIB67_012533 [Kingdonia uniflora]